MAEIKGIETRYVKGGLGVECSFIGVGQNTEAPKLEAKDGSPTLTGSTALAVEVTALRAEIERLRAALANQRAHDLELACKAGCMCCRDSEAWRPASRTAEAWWHTHAIFGRENTPCAATDIREAFRREEEGDAPTR